MKGGSAETTTSRGKPMEKCPSASSVDQVLIAASVKAGCLPCTCRIFVAFAILEGTTCPNQSQRGYVPSTNYDKIHLVNHELVYGSNWPSACRGQLPPCMQRTLVIYVYFNYDY